MDDERSRDPQPAPGPSPEVQPSEGPTVVEDIESKSETPPDDDSVPAGEEQLQIPQGVESSLPDDAPRIRLSRFEGPLDLLLYLIRRDKLDIENIPIAPITKQYMEYLALMDQLSLDVAGEFMVMAATLIHIKSRILVPVEPNEAESDEDAIDPRDELIRRLLEFERYKEAAGVLHQKAQIRAATWTRPDESLPRIGKVDQDELLEASLFDLISAFKELLDRRKVLVAHEVEADARSLEERMDEMLGLIREGDSLDFLVLFETESTKAGMIVTFLALLELIRLKRVKVYQKGAFGVIRVFRPVGPDAESVPPRDGVKVT
jgi:segregation and condensation protein A